MKKNLFALLLSLVFMVSFFYSCEKLPNNNVEESMTNLTKLSYTQGISQLDLKGLENDFTIKAVMSSSNKIEIFRVLKEKTFVEISQSNNIKLKKLFKNNHFIFQINDKTVSLDKEEAFRLLAKNEKDKLIMLVSIYIEMFDESATREVSATNIRNNKGFSTMSSCFKFESAIGFTSTGSTTRAVVDAKDYIDDHSDCHVVGYDTSCVTDGHLCVTTATLACSSSCGWWEN